MIKMQLYAIKDNRTGDFGPAMSVMSEVHAKREAYIATQQDTHVGKWPQDFDLYYVGDYDRDSGLLFPQPVVMVANLREIRDQNDNLEAALRRAAEGIKERMQTQESPNVK